MLRSSFVRFSPLVLTAAFFATACSASSRDSSKTGTGDNDGGAGTLADGGGIITPSGEGDSGPDAGCTQNVDIVFVMDVSSSMDAFLNKLAQEMAAVDTSIKTISPSANPYYGLAVFVDDVKLLNNGQPFVNVDTLKQEFSHWADYSKSNLELDETTTNTTWPENSLDAIYAAANSFTWRPGSLRIVIHTTDDTFWNGPTSQNGIAIQHGYQETVTKLTGQQVRVFSFASKLGGPDEKDDTSMGWFGPYQGMDAIPKATGGEAYELDGVLKGNVSLSTSIHDLVAETFCKPYPQIH